MPGMVQTCSNPINNGIIIILGGAGFCPSTVLCEYLEQDESQIERFTHTQICFDKNQVVGRSKCHILRSERDAAEDGVPCEGPMHALASYM